MTVLSRDKCQYMDSVAWDMTTAPSCFGMELASLRRVYLTFSPCEVSVSVQVLVVFSLSLAAVSNGLITLSHGLFS